MPKPEFEDKRIWEKLYAAEEDQLAQGIEEHAWTGGEDGEREFDRRVLANARGQEVLDIGCGTGEFTLQVAANAKRVVGIDFAERAIKKARENIQSKKMANVEFRLAPADKLPYPTESFELAISRRGPATDTAQSTMEAYRMLRKDGRLMTQEIGERDKQNWAQVFGRGQMYPGTTRVAVVLKERLTRAGFRKVRIEEFEANEYFATIRDALMRLENSPIIPGFDREVDARHIQEIVKRFTTPKGIITNSHRVLVDATK